MLAIENFGAFGRCQCSALGVRFRVEGLGFQGLGFRVIRASRAFRRKRIEAFGVWTYRCYERWFRGLGGVWGGEGGFYGSIKYNFVTTKCPNGYLIRGSCS